LTIVALALLAVPSAAIARRATQGIVHVTLTKATTNVEVGGAIVVDGTLAPAHRVYGVTLERRGTRGWTSVLKRRTTGRGAFAFSLRATTSGSTSYRVIAGSAHNALATSRAIRVAVKARAAVVAPLVPPGPKSVDQAIDTTVLPFGTLGVDYGAKLSAGAVRSGSWSIASGSLPAGIALATDGQLSGTPGALGSSTFIAAFTDASGARATGELTLTVHAPPPVTQIAAGFQTTCALRIDRTVWCWGANDDYELGSQAAGRSGTLSTPVPVDDLDDAIGVSVGYTSVCAVRASGTVDCWGHNDHGDTGTGTASVWPVRTPTPVVGVSDATQVSAGDGIACAVRHTGSVSCWGGGGTTGALGNGDVDDDSYVATSVVGITDATAVSAGDGVACALHATGTVSCWGSGPTGALGDGHTLTPTALPVTVVGLTDAVSISAGEQFTCAVRATGNVACWGTGAYGALGNGLDADSSVPVTVSGLTDAVAVDARNAACAIRRGGAVACWGENGSGQLGTGTRDDSWTPISASGLTGATSIAMGTGYGCAVTLGRVACWGANTLGQLGFPGGPVPSLPVPTLVNGV
jgi:alpha-tubulin suppressor-like RCC1 family protein